jgi:hypothetical protein
MVSTETIHEVTRVLLEGGKSLGRPYEHEPYESRVREHVRLPTADWDMRPQKAPGLIRLV